MQEILHPRAGESQRVGCPTLLAGCTNYRVILGVGMGGGEFILAVDYVCGYTYFFEWLRAL